MIHTLLIANRGEIARRIVRSCRRLGIATVAVHSDADARAAHVREADAAVALPGDAPADTYLRGDLLIKAALGAGADAVHPGYGFLSESPEFAAQVQDAGLVWVGPPPAAMAAMAVKTRAKELMQQAGVPLFAPLDPAAVTPADFPVLVKAAAGGGGRGMRIVRQPEALAEELAAARAEAASAFGDGEVFVEPYVERGRHVEVQILADAHGTTWALGTRDCSVQRRHQKVVEEAPAPGLTPALRAELHTAAVRAARAVDYVGAGTVEFLLTPDGRACFLEMNTRLQVEHPVTEAVYGLDLVALQLRVAEGESLPPEPPAPHGHAVEARLYAEDPARGWQPQTGPLHRFTVAADEPAAPAPGSPLPYVRLDSAVVDGDTVTPHYDPMLAKVVAWAPTRAEAVRRLAGALARARIHGPLTNRELLVRTLRHPEFAEGAPDTGFYDRHLAALIERDGGTGPGPRPGWEVAALAAALADSVGRSRLGGWRNLPSVPQTKGYRREPDGAEHQVRYRLTRDGLTAPDHPDVRPVHLATDHVVLELDGVRRRFDVARYGDRVHVDAPHGSWALTALPRFPDPTARTEPGSLLAPMPGTVTRIADGVAVGGQVTAGQPLLWLEAMKMEHRVTAPTAGTLTSLEVAPGHQVDVGALLAVVTDQEAAAAPAADEEH